MATDHAPFLLGLEDRLTDTRADLSGLTAEEQFALLKGRAVHVVKEDLLLERLRRSKQTGAPLRVKYGIDPTAAHIHLGHVASVVVARRLMRMGHHVVLLLGDFTAFVGDPTGRVAARPVLTQEQIRQNASSYTGQIRKFIDVEKLEVVYNSPFFGDMTILDLFRLYRVNKLAPLLQREDFRKRAEGLTIAEALYPTLMAIDSIKLVPDIELGGNDQFLNFQATVAFMESVGLPPQSALTCDLLQGLSGDGSKMSKSLGNAIPLTAPPGDAYGKLLSIPDGLMEHYFKLLTDLSDADWAALDRAMKDEDLNPMAVKKLLARVIVTFLHSKEAAWAEQAQFEKVHAQKELPDDMPEVALDGAGEVRTALDLVILCGFAKSKTEARRLFASRAVRWKVGDAMVTVENFEHPLPAEPSWVVNVGKNKFARVRRGK